MGQPLESMKSVVRQEILRITDAFEDANYRAGHAKTLADRDQAEAERREANGQFWAAGEELADLLLLLLRFCESHRPGALRMYLLSILNRREK